MDLSKLELLSTETLVAMKEKVADILSRRQDVSLRVGRVGWFKTNQGGKQYIRITRVNAKTVSGVAVDPITFMDLSELRGRWWRVSPNLLTIVPTERPKAAPQPYKPTSAPTATW